MELFGGGPRSIPNKVPVDVQKNYGGEGWVQ